jgi:uncharacterized protein YdeI (YjbR/CyaY-like superfamily)
MTTFEAELQCEGPGVFIDVPLDVPAVDDLAAALASDRERLDALSYSHRREYVEWVEEAKRPETRARRIAETVERIRAG